MYNRSTNDWAHLGCRCRVPYVQQRMYSLWFPNFNKLSCCDPPISQRRRHGCSDGSCRGCRVPLSEYRGAGSCVCNNGSAEGTGCFCWMLLCRVPCVQRKIRALLFTNRRPRTSRIRTFRIPHVQVLLRFPLTVPSIAGHQIWEFKIRQRIFFHTQLACWVFVWVCVIVWVRKCILVIVYVAESVYQHEQKCKYKLSIPEIET